LTSPRHSTSPRYETFKNRALIKSQEGFLELTLLHSDPLTSAPLYRDVAPSPEDPSFAAAAHVLVPWKAPDRGGHAVFRFSPSSRSEDVMVVNGGAPNGGGYCDC
jgi:hypothetical protein